MKKVSSALNADVPLVVGAPEYVSETAGGVVSLEDQSASPFAGHQRGTGQSAHAGTDDDSVKNVQLRLPEQLPRG